MDFTEKTFADASVNTEPLGVKLYFDDNNQIRTAIVFQGGGTITPELQDTKPSTSEPVVKVKIQSNEPLYRFAINGEHERDDTINTSLINVKTEQLKNIDDNCENFDYFKYCSLKNITLPKMPAWKHFLKNSIISHEYFILTSSERKYLHTFINVLTNAKIKEMDFVIVSFDDSSDDSDILLDMKSDKSYSIGILRGSHVNGSLTSIMSLFIRSNVYDLLLNELEKNKYTWEYSVVRVIDEIGIHRVLM
jgi:hypothetical protein